MKMFVLHGGIRLILKSAVQPLWEGGVGVWDRDDVCREDRREGDHWDIRLPIGGGQAY